MSVRVPKVRKSDIKQNRKRLNLCFTIHEFDQLALCAEFEKMPVSGYCYTVLMKDVAIKSKAIMKSGYVPEAQRGENLFKRK